MGHASRSSDHGTVSRHIIFTLILFNELMNKHTVQKWYQQGVQGDMEGP